MLSLANEAARRQTQLIAYLFMTSLLIRATSLLTFRSWDLQLSLPLPGIFAVQKEQLQVLLSQVFQLASSRLGGHSKVLMAVSSTLLSFHILKRQRALDIFVI